MKKVIVIVFIALFLGVGVMVYLGQRRVQSRDLYYSGTIEATQSELAFQVSGRVTEVLVDEGETVEQDQLLARLDDSELEARCQQARADLSRAREQYRRMELVLEINRNTLPAEVKRAEAALKALRSNLEEMESGYRTQDVEQARQALLAAEATMEEARRNKERYERLFRDKIVSEKERDAVDLKYETAFREYERAKENYGLLQEGFRKETIRTARAKVAEGEAVLRQARSNLKQIEAAAQDVEVARAQVDAAEAALKLAETQLGFTRLKAPFGGTITSRNVEPGEVVTPSREVLSLADLRTVDLKIFVDETEIGRVKPDQNVDVKVDTFPEKTYRGRVSFISPEGEFTPKIIQTHKERVKLVYLVKVSIDNPNLELKSGMPADAWLR